MLFAVCWFFFQNQPFLKNQLFFKKKLLSEISSKCQKVCIQIRPDILSLPDLGPNCLQKLSADNTIGKELRRSVYTVDGQWAWTSGWTGVYNRSLINVTASMLIGLSNIGEHAKSDWFLQQSKNVLSGVWKYHFDLIPLKTPSWQIAMHTFRISGRKYTLILHMNLLPSDSSHEISFLIWFLRQKCCLVFLWSALLSRVIIVSGKQWKIFLHRPRKEAI